MTIAKLYSFNESAEKLPWRSGLGRTSKVLASPPPSARCLDRRGPTHTLINDPCAYPSSRRPAGASGPPCRPDSWWLTVHIRRAENSKNRSPLTAGVPTKQRNFFEAAKSTTEQILPAARLEKIPTARARRERLLHPRHCGIQKIPEFLFTRSPGFYRGFCKNLRAQQGGLPPAAS